MILVRFLMLALLAGPAYAGGAIKVPEPGDAAIFILAVAGLLIGRQISKPRKPGGDR